MFKSKIKYFVLAGALALQAVVPTTLADFLNVRAYATDTVAGYASMLKSSVLDPGKEITFVVEKPDYSVVQVSATADPEGIATADLYGQQTHLAGVYKVAINYPGTKDASPQNTFTVYPDQVSATQSTLSSTDQMVEADGDSRTFVTVSLYDAYRNPISNHQVKLISSRPEDVITTINTGISNELGLANFKVTSPDAGVSVFTAMDASANTILSAREQIVFYASQPKAVGGNFFLGNGLQADVTDPASAAAGGTDTSASPGTAGTGAPAASQQVLPGPVNHFDIQDIPSTAKVNEDLTLTVIAKDKDGNVAKNYTGTVLISTPNDENAVLPNNGEYTFKEADQGKFTFNLALRFSTVGDQFVQVLDKDNWKISGQKELQVVPSQAVTEQPASSKLSIKSPEDGGKFGTSQVAITGQGDPSTNLKVFDDDIKIGDTQTDGDGFFAYQATNLAPGSHTVYVMSDSGAVSKSVTFTVDTIPPVLNSIDITPDGILQPGASLKIKVTSEPGLGEAKIRIQGIQTDLVPDSSQPGTYSASVNAPNNPGSYPVDVILTDALANKAELQAQKTLVVQTAAPQAPPIVQNPQGVPGDSEVLVSWDAITGYANGIAAYTVSYGTAMDKLDQSAKTDGPVTQLKISGLTNGTQYFFAVKAVDSKGTASTDPSTVIAVTPVASTALPATTTPSTGELLPAAPQAPAASLYGNPLTGTVASNTVTLNWQPFPGVTAAFYKVYFGLNSGQYEDYTVTPDDGTTYTVNDLINNVPYYFAVVAINAGGNEISPLSAELKLTPQGSGFMSLPSEQVVPGHPGYASILSNMQLSKVPGQEETGPETTWVVIGAITMAATVFYFNRRKLFR